MSNKSEPIAINYSLWATDRQVVLAALGRTIMHIGECEITSAAVIEEMKGPAMFAPKDRTDGFAFRFSAIPIAHRGDSR